MNFFALLGVCLILDSSRISELQHVLSSFIRLSFGLKKFRITFFLFVGSSQSSLIFLDVYKDRSGSQAVLLWKILFSSSVSSTGCMKLEKRFFSYAVMSITSDYLLSSSSSDSLSEWAYLHSKKSKAFLALNIIYSWSSFSSSSKSWINDFFSGFSSS